MSERAPRIITRRSIILSVARRWRASYPDGGKHNFPEVGEALDKINLATCDRSAVDQAIGNDSWTRLECSVCEMDREVLVSIPREYSEPVSICAECANGVLSIFADHASEQVPA